MWISYNTSILGFRAPYSRFKISGRWRFMTKVILALLFKFKLNLISRKIALELVYAIMFDVNETSDYNNLIVRLIKLYDFQNFKYLQTCT